MFDPNDILYEDNHLLVVNKRCGDLVQPDPSGQSALEDQIKAFINLDMDPQRKPEFYPYIRSCPHVVECNCVTGDYSMLIEVLFGTTQELDQFINHLQQFGRTRTQIVFSTPVEHRGVPVAEPEEKQ